MLRPDLDGEVSEVWVCKHTRSGRKELRNGCRKGPSPVANSLSCSKESLDQGEGLGGESSVEAELERLVTYDIFW